MADGGSLLFEKRLEQIVDKEFEKRGLPITHILGAIRVFQGGSREN